MSSESQRRLLISIRHQDGSLQQLAGRAAYMVIWVALNWQRINEASNGNIHVDWGGDDLKFTGPTAIDRVSTREDAA